MISGAPYDFQKPPWTSPAPSSPPLRAPGPRARAPGSRVAQGEQRGPRPHGMVGGRELVPRNGHSQYRNMMVNDGNIVVYSS